MIDSAKVVKELKISRFWDLIKPKMKEVGLFFDILFV